MSAKKLRAERALKGKSGPEASRGKAFAQSSRVRWPAALVVVLVLSACRPAAAPDAPAVGGPFRLVDQNGQPVDQRLLRGKWSAVFFGYTFCPDTCPATLQALGAASRRLGAAGDRFQVVFISVDPARDTPSQLKTYLDSQGFPAHAVGLTGSPAQVAEVAKVYGVYYAKSGQGADYTVDHSAAVYLMNPEGRFDRPLAHDMTPDLIAGQIKSAEAAYRPAAS